MILRHTIACLTLSLAAGTAAAQWTVTGTHVPELTAFDTAMHTFMSDRGIPSGQLAVTWQGRLVLARGYTLHPGPQDIVTRPDSVFRLASVSKPIVATLIHRLIQDGQLSQEQTLGEFLDLTALPGHSADPRLASITVRDVMEHLAGFRARSQLGYEPMYHDAAIANAHGIALPIAREHILRHMNGVPLLADPGTTYNYSNYGYIIAGLVVEAASGMSLTEYANRVFHPIGVWDIRPGASTLAGRWPNEVHYHSGLVVPTVLDSSGALVPREYGGINLDNMLAAGAWTASAIELARWLSNLDDPSAPNAILDAASLARMFALPQNYPLPYTAGAAYYGSGWQVRDFGAGGITTWHRGSLVSLSASIARHRSGFSYAAIVNRRDETSDDWAGELETAIFAAFALIGQWPAHDLFPSQLPVIFRGGFD